MYERTVRLLGPVMVVWEGGEPPRFRSQRTMALLGYLAAEDRPISRAALAALFWPDEDVSTGKANLRRELHNLANILPGCWQTDRQTVRFAPGAETRVDAYALRRLDEAADWAAAAERVRGDFLEGVLLEDNLQFETWLLGERERWRQRAERVLSEAIDEAEQSGDHDEALRFARRFLQLLPWHEETHRTAMRLLALNGQRGAALRQYERCQAFLQEELGVDVSAETRALYERIRKSPTFALHNIPAPTTPLIGREAEVALLYEWLAEDAVRLITITGTGGIGKTRLALGLAQGLLERPGHPFTDGVYFISLASLGDPAHLVSEIAAVLHFSLRSRDERSPRRQLLDYLQGKQMLLILDNFEHLLKGAEMITSMLEVAPGVQVVVTSRERLRLQGEQVLPLQGLAYDDETGIHEEERTGKPHSPAARLFLSGARRVQPRFDLGSGDDLLLRRICQVVEGMPLALELAATWADTLSLPAIAGEIEQGLDFLETELSDMPGRHRSMTAVFDASWQRLSSQEQAVFALLSIFRGGFTREAARVVADATPQTLARLVRRSLLRYERDVDRYQIHELLRQYAASRLPPAEAAAVHSRHLRWFAAYVETLQPSGQTAGQEAVLERLETELGNLRAALEWSLQDPSCAPEGLRLAAGMEYFWLSRGDRSEGREWLSQLLAVPDEGAAPRIRARALSVAGRVAHVSGEARAKTIALCRESLTLQEALADDEGKVRTLCRLGQIERHHRKSQEAMAHYQEAFSLAQSLDDTWGMCTALHGLGAVAVDRRELEAARAFFQRGLSHARQIGDLRRTAHLLVGLALVEAEEKAWAKCYPFLQEAERLFRTTGHRDGLSIVLNHMGEIARAEGQYELAEHYYTETLALDRELGASVAIGITSFNLAQTYLMLGRLEPAIACLSECLVLGRRIDRQELVSLALEGFANAASIRNQSAGAAALWSFAANLRELRGDTLDVVDRLAHEHFVATAKQAVDDSTFKAAWAEGRLLTLDEVVAYALTLVADNIEVDELGNAEER